MLRRLLVVFAAFSSACGGAVEAETPHAELNTFIEDRVRSAGIVGLAAALIDDDRVEWTGTFGYADLEARREVDEHTAFTVASVSKTVVSILMMQLAEEGALALDDPVDGPLAFELRHPGHPDKEITPRMFATHTSGVIDDFIELGRVTTDGVDAEMSLGDFARSYTSAPEHFDREPGTRRDYSNSGIAILGAVIEGAAGETLPVLARRRVFEPIGMVDSGFLLSEVDVERLAVPYSGKRQDGAVKSAHQGYAFYPATSLKTSIHDLSRYLLAFMRFGATESGARILSAETATSMRAIQDQALDRDQAIVWYREKIGGYTMLGHNGSAIGFSAIMFFSEELGVGVIVLTNSDAFIRARLGDDGTSDALYEIAGRIAEEGAQP